MKACPKDLHLTITIVIFLLTNIASAQPTTKCPPMNSLTAEENSLLSEFTGASYIASDQEEGLRNVYISLSSRKLDNYLIELEDSYLFDVNDIEQCSYLPTYVTFNTMDNVWICMKSQVIILQCNKEWELKIGCGTFIELHRPFDTQVLGKIALSETLITDAFSITLNNICAGTYHLWFVYSVRVGKIIKSVKPIFISYPPCQCV